MSAILFSQKPLILGLKHFGFGLLSVGAVSGVTAASVQIAGNEKEIGPKIEMKVPQIPAVKPDEHGAQTAEITNSETLPKGFLGMMGAYMADGGMSIWDKNSPITPDAHAQAEAPIEAAHAADPHVTSVAEAANATPADHGKIKITTPQAGETTNLTSVESGVKVIRGNVKGGGTPLMAAPIAGLYAQGPNGLLPAIATDGRTSFEAYKRPYAGTGPKLALIVGGLGLNARITERAINQLPAEVTLSFVPNADNLQGWINKARAQGHEVMIELPMEPFDYPDNDPGPYTLMSSGEAAENARKLDYLLSRTTGYFAVTNYLGGRFSGSANAALFLKSLKSKGLGFISDGSANGIANAAHAIGVKAASAERSIDSRPSAADIMAQLGALEAAAKQNGKALGFGVGYSVTIDQIINYLGEAQSRGISLAPASSVAG